MAKSSAFCAPRKSWPAPTLRRHSQHTRRAYVRACSTFFAWCEDRGLILTTIRPFDVAAWVEQLQENHGAQGVKQQVAAVRMLFDWLITGQALPMNPAAAVRGPKHVVKTGSTPVLDAGEWRKLIDSIPTGTKRDLRDRALIWISGRKAPAGKSSCMRKAASVMPCPAITHLRKRCALTSMPPA